MSRVFSTKQIPSIRLTYNGSTIQLTWVFRIWFEVVPKGNKNTSSNRPWASCQLTTDSKLSLTIIYFTIKIIVAL